MPEAKDVLTSEQLGSELRGLTQWAYHDGGLVTVYKLDNARHALDLIAAIGDLAEESNHHPDLDWRYNRVYVRFSSHDAGGQVTTRDVSAAAAVSMVADRLGASADPEQYPAGT
jgi:4a-hydroxytetrahydrobiopterin dehydratase